MIRKELDVRDILLFLVMIMLIINTFLNLRPKKAEADTFRLDSCITSKPEEKPAAYLHVVTH